MATRHEELDLTAAHAVGGADIMMGIAMALDRRVDRLEQLMERLEAAVARLAEAQARTEERLVRLEAVVERLAKAQGRTDNRVAALMGSDLERRYGEYAAAYFQRILREIRLVSREEVGRLADGAEDRGLLLAAEREQLLWGDVVVFGRLRGTGADTYLLAEVSSVVDAEDVRRAADRAQLLRRATSLPTIAAVAGERITAEAEQQASALSVWRVLDGRTYAPGEVSGPPGRGPQDTPFP